MRSIPSQATSSTRIVVPVPIPVAANTSGDYDVYISMPDIWPGTKNNKYFAVRFANEDNGGNGQVWEDGNFRFKTGTTLSVTNELATDVAPPTVSITAPAPGNAISGNMIVTANASDNFGVVGVQFQYNGINFGQGEDMAAPYSASADTTLVPNGSYALTAVARDAAGNLTTSASVTINVSN